MTQHQTQGTILDTVGRAKHTLLDSRGPETALVTVHGVCAVSGCRAMNIVEVRSGTTSITCSSCGNCFDV